ncbi:MAG: hypothetical protein WAK82_30935 [Streptosporangiaceae bacterium]
MRFTLVARRIALLPALGLALALTATACSSSGSSGTASSSSTPASATASAPASSGGTAAATSSSGTATTSGAAAQITANWEKFFSASTPAAEKVKLLQNGSSFATAISAFTKLPLASGIGAKVTKVVVNSPTTATVTFNIVSTGGSSLLSGQTGTSVYQDGIWKVGDSSLCGLFKLIPGGSVPAACNSAS